MAVGVLLASVLVASGCAAPADTPGLADRVGGTGPHVAVFPVENLSGRPAPLEDIRRLLGLQLARHGLRVLDDAALETVMDKHRIRYTAGLAAGFAKALKEDAGVDAVVVPSLERYDDVIPPRLALFARLVSTGDAPAVLWVEGTGAAGDDAPGLLGIGLVEDVRVLLARAVAALAVSLDRHLTDAGDAARERAGPRKFRPKIVYRSEALDPARTYSIAVVPFFNKSARNYAGEIVALHMMRNLTLARNLAVVEPGVVREELLRFRIIMSEGISLPDTETVLNAVNADLVLNGEVLEYQEPLGPLGAPVVDFAVLFIERKSRRVLYSSYSQNTGSDGVFFFDWGRVNTAHAMAAHMARAISEGMLAGPPTAVRDATATPGRR
jgi:hypothetical protein